MSVFEDKQEVTPTEEAPVAEQKTEDTQPAESFVKKLVEARGDKWSDPEVIAKGKVEADAYISDLEAQLAQMREDLGKQDYASQLLDQLQKKAPTTTDGKPVAPNTNKNDTSGTDTGGHTNPAVSENDLKSLVEKALTEREAKATVDQNLGVVMKHLNDSYGTEANATVKKKADELGISLDRMEEIAKESPTAFFALIGDTKKPLRSMTSGSIRTDGVDYQTTGDRDWNYYQNLRRENKSLYYSTKVQRQLMEDKKRLGGKFGV
jgi:hypothetical protein